MFSPNSINNNIDIKKLQDFINSRVKHPESSSIISKIILIDEYIENCLMGYDYAESKKGLDYVIKNFSETVKNIKAKKVYEQIAKHYLNFLLNLTDDKGIELVDGALVALVINTMIPNLIRGITPVSIKPPNGMSTFAGMLFRIIVDIYNEKMRIINIYDLKTKTVNGLNSINHPKEMKLGFCIICDKELGLDNFRFCNKCFSSGYCSKECEEKDKSHSSVCDKLKNIIENGVDRQSALDILIHRHKFIEDKESGKIISDITQDHKESDDLYCDSKRQMLVISIAGSIYDCRFVKESPEFVEELKKYTSGHYGVMILFEKVYSITFIV